MDFFFTSEQLARREATIVAFIIRKKWAKEYLNVLKIILHICHIVFQAITVHSILCRAEEYSQTYLTCSLVFFPQTTFIHIQATCPETPGLPLPADRLRNPKGYPGAWQDLGKSITDRGGGRGCWWRLLGDPCFCRESSAFRSRPSIDVGAVWKPDKPAFYGHPFCRLQADQMAK